MTAVRRWGPWALLAIATLAALIVGLHGAGGRPSLDAQVQHISSEVRCPVCHGETVAQSQAAPSVEIRNQIRTDLQRGESQGRILSSIVASYGPGILEKPQASGLGTLVWILPVAGVIVAGAGLAVALSRWRRSGPADALAPPPIPAPVPVPGGIPAATAPAVGAEEAPRRARHPVARRRPRLVLGCVGVALVAGGASWAVAASAGTRLPGQEITGQSVGSEQVAADLQAAQTAENRNNVFGAIQDYQKVLVADPTQAQALAGEGWLLAETGQPALLKQGLSLLGRAEVAQPGFAPAHLYRGLALLGEADYQDCVPELQWYLAHGPDAQLVPQVRKALAQAKGALAAASATTP